MFEELFKRRPTVERHQNAPYAEERSRYLAFCAQRGYTKGTLLFMARELFWVAHKLAVHPEHSLNAEQIKAAARGWTERERCCGQKMNPRWTRERFLQVARPWLRFLGRLSEPVQPTPFAHLSEDFAQWQDQERGLSPRTIQHRQGCIRQFLLWYGDRSGSFSEVQIADLDTFLAACAAKGWSRYAMKNMTHSLRAFFRHSARQGWCSHRIAEAIQGPRIFRQEVLPAGPAWQDVRRLLGSMDTHRPPDLRDRAIVMFLAIYGWRASEVAKLRLEDIDWNRRVIRLPRSKQRATQTYPLLPLVGNALLRYLQEVRPRCLHREVFLTLIAPVRPVSRSVLYSLTSKRMVELGIHSRHRGPHSLRHACAAHLVSEGFSLKEIGDHLGHRSASATRIYAKVDLPGLRQVAAFDLGGLL